MRLRPHFRIISCLLSVLFVGHLGLFSDVTHATTQQDAPEQDALDDLDTLDNVIEETTNDADLDGQTAQKDDEDLEKPARKMDAQKEALEEYERRYLWLGERMRVTRYGAERIPEMYAGKYKREVTNEEFYALLDDSEVNGLLEDAMTTRLLWSGGWAIASAGVMLVGAALLTGGAVWGISAQRGEKLASGALILGGLGLLVPDIFNVAVAIPLAIRLAFMGPPSVLSPAEMREKAAHYNEKLKKELGLEHQEGLPGISSLQPRRDTYANAQQMISSQQISQQDASMRY